MQKSLKKGDIVASKMGHDEGRIYIVTEDEREDFVYLSDGKYRKLDKQKKKRVKHLRYLSSIELKDKIYDADIIRAIKNWRENAER